MEALVRPLNATDGRQGQLVDPATIEAAMRPFLVAESDGLRWRSQVARRWAGALVRFLSRREICRDSRFIEREYEAAWAAGYQRYRLGRTDLHGKPWSWRGRLLLVDPAAATRLRTLMFAAVIAELKPQRVLEVGSGNGINLLSLAGAFPEIEFTGLELTHEGVEQARHALSDRRSPPSSRPTPRSTPVTPRRSDASGSSRAMRRRCRSTIAASIW